MIKRIALLLAALALIASPAAAQSTTARFDRYTFNLSGCTQRSDNTNSSPEGRVVGSVCDSFSQVDGTIWTKISGSGTNTGWLVLGHVTSVGLSMPSIFSVSGSPVTTSGTLTATLNTQAATSVFAGPASGSPAVPTFTTTPTLTGLTVNADVTLGASGTGTTTIALPAPIMDFKSAVIRNRAPWANFVSDWYVDNQTGVTHWVAYDKSGSGTYMAMEFKGSGITLDADTTMTGAATIAGNTNISGYVGHPSFTSQTSKWRIDNLGGADFRYLYTDELHAVRFIADLERALAGGEIISKSVAVLASDFACPATPGIGALTVEDLPGASDMDVFEAGDWVVVRTFSRAAGALTVGDCVGQVSAPDTSASGTQTWVFTRPTTGGGSLTPGTISETKSLALDYGISGNGAVETTTVDGTYGANSPYTQVKTWATTPAAGNFTTRTRIGNLKGITGTTEWGALFGPWAATAGQYLLMSDQHFEIHGVKLQMFNGSTEVMRLDPLAISFAMGTTLPTSFTSGTGCWQGFDAGVFKWRCGDHATNYIEWNGTQLTVSGNIVVTGTSIDASSVNGVAGSTVVSGAARGLLGIDSNGNPLLPHTATPSGSGLFIGSDFMGYYASSAWKTYMDQFGNFYLGGTSGPLQWNAGTSTLTIAHSAGTAGGWTLSASAIKDTAGVVGMSSAVTGGNDCRFWAGNATCASAPFRVFEDGSMVASSGTFTGSVTTDTGNIGGWTLAAGAIYFNGASPSLSGGMAPADYPFYAGEFLSGRASAPFRVNTAGALVATNATITGAITATTLTATTSGNIAGWLLSANSLTDTAGVTGLSSVVTGGDDCRFFAGNVTCSSAPFRVYESGAVNLDSGSFGNGGVVIDSTGIAVNGGGHIVAGGVTLTTSGVTAGGTALTGSGITADEGSIGGFTLGSTDGLYSGSGSSRVQMKPGAGFWAGADDRDSAPFRVTEAGIATFLSVTMDSAVFTGGAAFSGSGPAIVSYDIPLKLNYLGGSGSYVCVDGTGFLSRCSTPSETEITELRREVAELRQLLQHAIR